MQQFIWIIIGFLLICYGCQSGSRTETSTTSTTVQDTPTSNNQMQCFLRTEGMENQDSLSIQLTVQGNEVSGTYNVVLYEKDARRGTVQGHINGEVVDLIWTYMQEGIQDTMRVVFALRDGQLLQKPLSVDPLSGREFTSDSSSFSETYHKVQCSD